MTRLYLWILWLTSAPQRGRNETLGRWRRRQIDAAIRRSEAEKGVFV